ncbi:MAG: lytic transglycosylase domain-containing protein [Candidatus Aminicenantaceae bacterium]
MDSFVKKIACFGIIVLCVIPLLTSDLYANSQLKTEYDNLIRSIAQKYRVEHTLIHSIIRAESNYDRFAVSPKGALGLMQLMPATAIQYGVKNVFDPRDNIEGGVKYLKDLIKLYNGNTKLVLAAYNAGQEAVKKYNGIPPYRETKNYIYKIMDRFGYDKDFIKGKTVIYKFYDKDGKLWMTDDRAFYLKHKNDSSSED